MIRDDETTHLTTLQSVATSLGGSTSDVDSCTFDFESALADVPTFLATARVLEVIGVNAYVIPRPFSILCLQTDLHWGQQSMDLTSANRYIGGTTLIEDKGLLVSAAEIATVEARHSSMLNLLNGMSGRRRPQAGGGVPEAEAEAEGQAGVKELTYM